MQYYTHNTQYYYILQYNTQYKIILHINITHTIHNIITYCNITYTIHNIIATLGSILKSQLSWRSEKPQLARWTTKWYVYANLKPPTHHPHCLPWKLQYLSNHWWKVEYLSSHWSDLPQILNINSWDQTKVKKVFHEDDLRWKTTSSERWPQNMKSWISQQPLIRSSSNFKHKLMGPNKSQKRFWWRRPSMEDNL